MCFGSTQLKPAATKPVAATAAQPTVSYNDYSESALTADIELSKAFSNKKGKRTEDAFDVLGNLIRARRDGRNIEVNKLIDQYVISLK